MATHFSILAGKIPWTEEPGGLQSTGSQRVGCNLELARSNINQLNLIPMETSTAAESKLSTSVTAEPTGRYAMIVKSSFSDTNYPRWSLGFMLDTSIRITMGVMSLTSNQMILTMGKLESAGFHLLRRGPPVVVLENNRGSVLSVTNFKTFS